MICIRACCVHMGSRNPLYIVVFRAASRGPRGPALRLSGIFCGCFFLARDRQDISHHGHGGAGLPVDRLSRGFRAGPRPVVVQVILLAAIIPPLSIGVTAMAPALTDDVAVPGAGRDSRSGMADFPHKKSGRVSPAAFLPNDRKIRRRRARRRPRP